MRSYHIVVGHIGRPVYVVDVADFIATHCKLRNDEIIRPCLPCNDAERPLLEVVDKTTTRCRGMVTRPEGGHLPPIVVYYPPLSRHAHAEVRPREGVAENDRPRLVGQTEAQTERHIHLRGEYDLPIEVPPQNLASLCATVIDPRNWEDHDVVQIDFTPDILLIGREKGVEVVGRVTVDKDIEPAIGTSRQGREAYLGAGEACSDNAYTVLDGHIKRIVHRRASRCRTLPILEEAGNLRPSTCLVDADCPSVPHNFRASEVVNYAINSPDRRWLENLSAL